MKIIFLDMDGVLVHPREGLLPLWRWTQETCPECVAELNRITRTTGAKIVVSSAWRHNPYIKEFLKDNGVEAEIIGITPDFPTEERGFEIAHFAREIGVDPSDFVILDDDSDMGDLLPRLVRTTLRAAVSEDSGLTKRHADEAIRLLGGTQ